MRAREALEVELPGTGTLAERVSAFRRRFVVPEARRETVMRLALDQCRAAPAPSMPLPADESIDLAFVAGLPWDAHARYIGRHQTLIEVNAAGRLISLVPCALPVTKATPDITRSTSGRATSS